jgi:Tfp pilus assembly protein PilF
MLNQATCTKRRLKRIEVGALVILVIIIACCITAIYWENSRISRSLEHAARAEAYFNQGKVSQSISELEKSIQDNPHNPGAYEELAAIWSLEKKYDKAIEVYHAALHKMPRKAILYQELSKVYFMKKDYCRAMQSLEKAESLEYGINPRRLISLYRQQHGKMPSHECHLEELK